MAKEYAISKIVHDVSCKYGAPMGRSDIGTRPTDPKIKIYDRPVPMSVDAGYDKGGVYWGTGRQLRVEYTKDLSYVRFYRVAWKRPFGNLICEVGDTVYYRGMEVVVKKITWREHGKGLPHDKDSVLGGALDWCTINDNMSGEEIRTTYDYN